MKRFSLFIGLFVFSFSFLFAQYYNSYTYVVGDFELCQKNFVEQMDINEMSEDSYRVYSNTFRKVPAGSYEFIVQYYSVNYGFESIDAEHSTPGYFVGNTNYSSKYVQSHAIGFSIDTVSDITIKFNRNTDKVILLTNTSFVAKKPFVYLEYNNVGAAEVSKYYLDSDDDFYLNMPFRKGGSSIRISKDFKTPLPVNAECSNLTTRGSNPILFNLEEETEVTVRIVDNKVCISVPVVEVDSAAVDSTQFNLYDDPDFYDESDY